jgi:hypothetical protein
LDPSSHYASIMALGEFHSLSLSLSLSQNWAQGLLHARQVLYHLSHTPSSVGFAWPEPHPSFSGDSSTLLLLWPTLDPLCGGDRTAKQDS